MEIRKVAEDILVRLQKEKKLKAMYPAIGRGDVEDAGRTLTTWIIRRIPMGSLIAKDFAENVVGTVEGPIQYLDEGLVIARDGKLGEFILIEGVGTVEIPSPRGKQRIKVISGASYVPAVQEVDAKNGHIIGESAHLRFRSLREKLNLELDIEILKQKLEDEKISEVAAKLREEIDEKNARLKRLQTRITEHIIRSSTLRDQPVLDKVQERIKRSKILDGGLIIDGGPGTGKTTSLIQRITFLTSQSIKEYRQDLKPEDEQILFDQTRSWIFFSPSELLREYLRNAMIGEGLASDKDRVRVWEGYRRQLMKEFGFIRADSDRSFLSADSDSPLMKADGRTASDLIGSLDQFFLDQQTAKLKRISDLNLSEFSWSGLGKSIQNDISESVQQEVTFSRYVEFYETIRTRYFDRAKTLLQALDNTLAMEVSFLIVKVEGDELLRRWFEDLLRSMREQAQAEGEEEIEETDPEDEESPEVQSQFDFRAELSGRLTTWLRRLSLALVDVNTKLIVRDREVREKLSTFLSDESLRQIAQGAYFRKYFGKIVRGIERNILAEVPSIYKRYRRQVLAQSPFLVESERPFLIDLVAKRNNRIHRDEMDVILLLTFRLVHAIYKIRPRLFVDSAHPYISNYRASTKAVVAIDEATDFSPLQLACMSFLAHPRFQSVTLSGDLMQTMTAVGIKSWEEFQTVFPGTSLETMSLSYRQTPRLLELAKAMYEKTTGTKATFDSVFEPDDKDPPPLLFASIDKTAKANWIAERIVDIYKIYKSKIPSIAVFLASEAELNAYGELLGQNEQLSKYDIKVAACRDGKVLGDAEDIRLFSIQYIKGMEFQAVFFVDLDALPSLDDALLERYMYVGLSRASFFLGVTVNKSLPPQVSYLAPYFGQGGWQ